MAEAERRLGERHDLAIGQLQQLERRLRRQASQLIAAQIHDSLKLARHQALRDRRRLL